MSAQLCPKVRGLGLWEGVLAGLAATVASVRRCFLIDKLASPSLFLAISLTLLHHTLQTL